MKFLLYRYLKPTFNKKLFVILICLSTVYFSSIELNADYNPSSIIQAVPTRRVPATRIVCDNGLVCLLTPYPSSKIASIQMWIKSGSAQESDYLGSGMAHFVEHLLFKDTVSRTSDEIEQQIKSYGGTINAVTSHDYTAVLITVPCEYIKPCLEILSDMLFHPLFKKKEVEKERQVIFKEQNLRDDEPDTLIVRNAWREAFDVHAYKYPIIGYSELLKNLTREDIVEWHGSNYVANNMVLSIAGDIDTDKTYTDIKDIFGKYPRQEDPKSCVDKEPAQVGMKIYEEIYPVDLARLVFAFQSTDIYSSSVYPLDILAQMLGQGADSIFERVLHVEKDLIYTANVYNFTPRDQGLFIMMFLLKPENIPAVKKEVFSIISNIKRGKFDSNYIDRIKKSIYMDSLYSFFTVSDTASTYASNEVITGNYKFTDYYMAKIRRVNKKDIIRAANTYLVPQKLTIAALLPEEKYSLLKQNTISKKKHQTETISKKVLKNGITVVFKKSSYLPLVSIRLMHRGGLLSELKSQNGIAYLTSQLLLKGTEKYNREGLAKIIDLLGGRISSISGNNSFFLSADVHKDDLDTALDLLKQALYKPVFEEEEITREKEMMYAALSLKREDIFYQGILLLKKAMYKSHPYAREVLGQKDILETITRQDIKDYYLRHLDPKQIVISVVGDIDVEDAIGIIEDKFGYFENPFIDITASQNQIPAQNEPVSIEETMDKKQALVLLGYRGITFYDKDRYVFDVLASALSGGSGRVYKRIREKHGLSYTLGFFSFYGVDPGFVSFYSATTNENIEKVKNELYVIIDELKKNAISEDELASSKREVIAQLRQSLQNNAGLATEIGFNQLYGLGTDYHIDYENNINKVTIDDIKRVCEKYFTDKSLVQVVVEAKEDENHTPGV